jgi:hypothetical protein
LSHIVAPKHFGVSIQYSHQHIKVKPYVGHWWGFEGGKNKMHWRSWDWLTTPKFMGGMGFRDMKLFNQAMLGRQCWRLMAEPDSLCAKVLKGRYYTKCSFIDSVPTRSSSFTWRSLMYGKSLLERDILW